MRALSMGDSSPAWMNHLVPEQLDDLFRQAVAAIDKGDVSALEALFAAHPRLVRDRLESPGAWLREKVGRAFDADEFFHRPYLLWFVAEDPVRNGSLPPNIADVARAIIRAAKRGRVESVLKQLDYALRLVCWSQVARECGVQIQLIDVLVDAGASIDGHTVYQGRFGTNSDAAIYNGNYAAAEHLVERGATLTLSTALCLERWADAEQLARTATLSDKQDAFVQAAKNGKAEALRRMLALGVAPTTLSARNQSHGTALHHAVWSGSLEAVKVLVEAGADLARRDTIFNATPLGWAEYGAREQKEKPRAKQYTEIPAYLREKGCKT
jgi:peptide-methionine (S)-S-oxide reductase